MQKRGQITIFIIIGIVLLLSAALFLYVRSKIIERAPTRIAVEEIPTELDPVRSYIQDCLKTTLIDGFRILGARGGYINPEKFGIAVNNIEPTESNAVSFSPDDPNSPSVAYWHYFSSRNTCLQNCRCDSKQPPLCKQGRKDCFSTGQNSIEAQLEEYIKENLNICLMDFVPLIEQGFQIKKTGEMQPSVTITKSNVRAYLKYPLQTEKANIKKVIPDFFVELPFEFMKIYEFASQITKAKKLYFFFERWIMNVIDGLGGLKSAIPKTYYVDFSPGSAKIWTKPEIREQIVNNILPGYISALRVYNTQNFEPKIFPNNIATGIYRFRDLPIGSTQDFDFSDLKVNFIYFPDWPIYFDISGRGISGSLVTAEQGSAFEEFFSWLGLKRYQYYYDISFPVIIEITDLTQNAKNLFGSSGYRFQFALEANIRDNKELNCTGPGLDIVTEPMTSRICDQIHFKSGNIIIETIDKKTKKPLEDVAIIYQCGKETGCDIGYSKINNNISSPYYGKGVLITKLPYPCIGGYLVAKKDAYFADPIEYNTAPPKDDRLLIELEPIRKIKGAVVKKRIVKQQKNTWVPAPGFGALLPNEIATITLERIKPNYAASDFNTVLMVQGNTKSEINLIPGNYKIKGTLTYNLPALDRDVISFRDEEICAGMEVFGTCVGNTQTLHIDPFNESFMEGGIELDRITIPSSYLDGYDTLYFKIVSIPDSSSFGLLSFSDINLIGQYDSWSKTLSTELNPEPTIFTYSYAPPSQDNLLGGLLE